MLLLLLFFTRKRGREDSTNLLGWWCHVAVSPCRRVVPWVACGMLPCTIQKSSIIKHHVITTPPWKTEIREIGVFWRWWCWHDWADQPFLGGTSMNIKLNMNEPWILEEKYGHKWGSSYLGNIICIYIYIQYIYMVWVYRAIILSIQLAIRKIYRGRREDESFSLWFQLTWGNPQIPKWSPRWVMSDLGVSISPCVGGEKSLEVERWTARVSGLKPCTYLAYQEYLA